MHFPNKMRGNLFRLPRILFYNLHGNGTRHYAKNNTIYPYGTTSSSTYFYLTQDDKKQAFKERPYGEITLYIVGGDVLDAPFSRKCYFTPKTTHPPQAVPLP